MLSACETGNHIYIDSQRYAKNDDGAVIMTKLQLDQLVADGKVIRIDHISKGDAIVATPAGMASLLRYMSEEPSTSVIPSGSLHDGLKYFARDNGFEKLQWLLEGDLTVSESLLVTGNIHEKLAKIEDHFGINLQTNNSNSSLIVLKY